MDKVLKGSQEQINVVAENYIKINQNLDEHTLALVSIYEALGALANKLGVELPKPRIDMSAEYDEKKEEKK
jgi:hypothetical protein